MQKFVNGVRHLLISEDGPTAVEYALMVALIAIVAIAAIRGLGDQLDTTFTDITGEIATSGGGG